MSTTLHFTSVWWEHQRVGRQSLSVSLSAPRRHVFRGIPEHFRLLSLRRLPAVDARTAGEINAAVQPITARIDAHRQPGGTRTPSLILTGKNEDTQLDSDELPVSPVAGGQGCEAVRWDGELTDGIRSISLEGHCGIFAWLMLGVPVWCIPVW